MSLLGYIKAAATTLGITTVKAEKEEAIMHFALGRDVFVALPTGSRIWKDFLLPSSSVGFRLFEEGREEVNSDGS